MRRSLRSAFFLLAFLSLVARALPQGAVHVVDFAGGPGSEFRSIEAAMAVAADGDVVLVRSGVYGSTLGHRVTVVAEAGALVKVDTLFSSGLQADRSCLIQGLSFLSLGTAVVLRDARGPIWFERCEFNPIKPLSFEAGFLASGCDTVVLSRCRGFPESFDDSALVVGASRVHVHESELRGGHSFFDALERTVHARSGSFLEVFGSSVLGADGADGSQFSCNGEDGTDGIHLEDASRLVSLGSILQGGSGGAPFGNCNPGADGKAVVIGPGSTATYLAGVARSLSVSSPVREDEAIQATLRGEPGDRVWLRYSQMPGHGVGAPRLQGELLVCSTATQFFAGTLPASGELVLTVDAPDLPPGWESTVIFSQAVMHDADTGRFVVSSPSALVLLDDAL